MEGILETFRDHLRADGKSPATVASYCGDVRDFLRFLESEEESGTGITRGHVTLYRGRLVGLDLKPATVNKKVNSLSSFCAFLKEKGLLNAAASPVVPKKDRVRVAAGSEAEVSTFSEEEVRKILLYVQDPRRVTLRNRLIVNLLLYTGARVSEVVGIRLRDLDFATGELQIIGKGGKVRTVPLRSELIDMIRDYLKTERRESRFADSPYLLLSQRSGQMRRDAINNLLERMGEGLGLRCHPHKFRHTFCTRLLATGRVPITTVAKLAGHEGIQTTTRYYISTSKQDKLDAVNLL